MFTNAVVRRRRLPAASWSSVWYLLSSFAVISYTSHWFYVLFAAAGSFFGAYASIGYLHGSARTTPRPRWGRPGADPAPALSKILGILPGAWSGFRQDIVVRW